MGVVVTTSSGQQVIVQAGQTLKSLGTESLGLTVSEQEICRVPGGTPSQVTGYIDLTKMQAGDTVVIKFYAKLKDTGSWIACYEDTYTGPQVLPLIHVAKRPENHGLRITIRQTAGSYKDIEYEFFEES